MGLNLERLAEALKLDITFTEEDKKKCHEIEIKDKGAVDV